MHPVSEMNQDITIGAVVQLVRIHACHAWGRGFESRPHRKKEMQSASLFFVVLGQRELANTQLDYLRLRKKVLLLIFSTRRTSYIYSVLNTNEEPRTNQGTPKEIPTTKKCFLLRLPLLATCLAFANGLANLHRSLRSLRNPWNLRPLLYHQLLDGVPSRVSRFPLTTSFALAVPPSPSSPVARRCPVSRLPISSHH